MTLNLMFKYLIGLAFIVGVFAKISWSRTEEILKDYIVSNALTQLHTTTSAKVNEIESKIKYYQLASQEIAKKLSVKRENFGSEGLDADLVAVDLFTLKEGKFKVTANFTNSDFVANRSLTNDFIKETVGANPLDFSRLQFNKYFIQKLTASDKKTQLLAVASYLPDHNSVVVVYADLQRFQSLFAPMPGYNQYMFESVGGLIAHSGQDFTGDINEHPVLVELNKNNKSVLQNKYFDKLTTENFYATVIRSAGGFYVLTEASEDFLWKSVYLMKSNFVKAVGILFSAIVVLLSLMGLFSSQKVKHLVQQLEDYAQKRELKPVIKDTMLNDEFDDLSHQIRSTFVAVEQRSDLGHILQKFGGVNLADKLNFKSVNLDLSESEVLAVQLELVVNNSAVGADVVKEYDLIRKKLEEIISKTNGVVISQINLTMTLAWGLFDENMQINLRGLNSLLEIESFLKHKISEPGLFKTFMLSAAKGNAVIHLSPHTGEIFFFGNPFSEVQKAAQLHMVLEQNIVVTKELADSASQYFNFTSEFKFTNLNNQSAFQQIRSLNMNGDVVRLTHRTREIISVAN